jgi:hypothetical protein
MSREMRPYTAKKAWPCLTYLASRWPIGHVSEMQDGQSLLGIRYRVRIGILPIQPY